METWTSELLQKDVTFTLQHTERGYVINWMDGSGNYEVEVGDEAPTRTDCEDMYRLYMALEP